MFKKAKLYSLLAVIVASTVVGLISFSSALAQDAGDTSSAKWIKQDNGSDPEILYAGKYYARTGAFEWDDEALYKYCTNNCSGTTLDDLYFNDDRVTSGYVQIYQAQERDGKSTGIIYILTESDKPLSEDVINQTTSAVYATFAEGSNQFTFTGTEITITITGNATDEEVDNAEGALDGDSEDSSHPSSCQIKSIGWLVCPVVNFLAEVTDESYQFLNSKLLKVEPIALSGSGESGMKLYEPWRMMRDFANIVFIIGFLLIVFSQITNIGINNYGIKRLLPKIIIAAILVNLSYMICAVAIDLSNILGNNLRELLTPKEGLLLDFKFSYDGNDFSGHGWQGLTGVVIGAGAIAAIGYVFLPVFLPLVISAALAVVTVVITLTLRQALIVILVIISPLAFVALLLPNTESYFQKWRSLFTAMLLVYPIISVVFGASALASNILMNATDDFWTQMVGAGVSIIPLFITPIIMKVSGGLLNRWVGLVNDPSKGWIDGKRNSLKEKGQIIRAGRANRYGNFTDDPTRANRMLGGAGSRRRRLLTWGTAYGQNNRERARKDKMNEIESTLESTYLDSEQGQQARNAAKNAQINLQNAQLNADTVRLSSLEGVALETQTKRAEITNKTEKDIATARAISSIDGAVAGAAKEAELTKETSENRLATAAANNVSRTVRTEAYESGLEKQNIENRKEAAAIRAGNGDIKVQSEASAELLNAAKNEVKQGYEEAIAGKPPASVSGSSVAQAQAARRSSNIVSSATEGAKRVSSKATTNRILTSRSLAADMSGIDPGGERRVRASAEAAQLKAEKEELDNSIQLLSYEAINKGKTLKDYALTVVEDEIGTSGKHDPQMVEAALEAIAQDGQVSKLRDARMSGNIDQKTLTKVLARNSNIMKQKGGFDLQNDPSLAGATQQQMDLSVAKNLGDIAASNIPDVKSGEWKRIAADISRIITTANTDPDALAGLQKSYVALTEALRNPDTRAGLTDRMKESQDIHTALNAKFSGTMTGYEIDFTKPPKDW